MTPPRGLLLVHGAGSGPEIYREWPDSFPELIVRAVDLQKGLRPDEATMLDYVRAVLDAATRIERPTAICGWSMGGLVALQAAAAVQPSHLILLEPSPPAEVQGCDLEVVPRTGSFDPQVAYGRFPSGETARSESTWACGERKRGISVPCTPCPTLVVSGLEFPDDRGRAIAMLYGAQLIHFPELDHWGLVRDGRVRARISGYLGVVRSSS